ncbi:VOC family protein [Salinicoccus halitifaciens]|uniref:PhnB protein n=1 Tax=Salinicoccus halitifaciens TaxID=1073415 RepID=A0ABV2E8V9_9STAP|nr:glyoxalase/bleomycin resistance/extradiol dioxygenase family protein [Salinicoccus halitifaciens]MCD2137873.1 glyoxalase/bleomycin resistance/extradiol dioxygenase family protein [Salinicoccus halitifaciens]
MFKAVPYFNFKDALEAIDYYVEYFDAEVVGVTKEDHEMFEGSLDEMNMTREEAEKFIMNAEIRILGEPIYISSTWGGKEISNEGTQVAFIFDGDDEEAVETVTAFFEKASAAAAEVSMPLGPVEWSKLFGAFTDKYGVDWMISAE